MSALDAAFEVLSRAGEPLTAAEITKRMLDQNLWATTGKTPKATVNARIAEDIKLRGSRSRFKRTGPATFTVNE